MNTLTVNYTQLGLDTYARLSGSLRSLGAIALNEKMHTQVAEDQKLIVDMTEVTDVDLTGLNALLSTRIKCSHKKAKMVLKLGVKNPLRDLLALTKFENQFDYFLPTQTI